MNTTKIEITLANDTANAFNRTMSVTADNFIDSSKIYLLGGLAIFPDGVYSYIYYSTIVFMFEFSANFSTAKVTT